MWEGWSPRDKNNDDDEDDDDLGGHGKKGGHPERHSGRDGVLVEPETHLITKEGIEAKSIIESTRI